MPHEFRPFAKRQRRANVEGGRQYSHQVKVTPEEEAMLMQRAAAAHVSVPRLLVEAALADSAGTSTETRETIAALFALHRLLGGIANNVNQQAKAANATGELAAEIRGTLAAVRRTCDRIDAAVNELAA